MERIVGVDISDRALDHVRKTAAAAGLDNIELRQGSIEALEGLPDDSLDTVVLNSTVQYLPSAEFLERLIGVLVRVTRPDGAIFLGDIRHLGLLETFHAEIALGRADPGTPASAVARAVALKVEEEQELLLDPHWFLAMRDRFPEIGDVEIQLKRGAGHNELARFRYDVVLHLGKAVAARSADEVRWGEDVGSLDEVMDRAASGKGRDILVRCIPNARIASACIALQMLHEAGRDDRLGPAIEAARAVVPEALSPEDVWSACEERGLTAKLGWNVDLSRFDLLVTSNRGRGGPVLAGKPPDDAHRPLANSPARGRALRQLEFGLAGYLERLLPDYMLPQAYIRVDEMPLTPNGKLDRKALMQMVYASAPRASGRLPRTDTEKALAQIICAVLQLPQVGLDDDFFRIGGHSLKATQVISRIRAAFGVALPLREIFENGTVEGLAAAIEQTAGSADDAGPSARATAVDDDQAIEDMDADELERALAALDASGTGYPG